MARPRTFVAVLLPTLLMLAAAPVVAQSASPPSVEAPWMQSIRTSERAALLRQAQTSDGAELPRYDLALDVADDLSSFTLDETAIVHNRGRRPWAEVVFRVFVNAVAPAGEAPLVELVSGNCLDGVRCAASAPSPDLIVVRPVAPLAPGQSLRVHLSLRGRMRPLDPSRTTMMGQGMESLGALSGGHGGGDYGLLSVSDGVANMANFVPVLARRRAGRWEGRDASTLGDLGNDELAHFTARVVHADGVRVFATGLESPGVVGDRAETRIQAGFVRDFALSLSGRYQVLDRDVGGVRVRSVYIGDANGRGASSPDSHARRASAEQVLDAAAGSLELFERRFGPYPFTELDVVEAPLVGGAGGVEFTGMVTVATMFYRPMGAGGLMGALSAMGGGANLEGRRAAMLEFVTAHEVAHQWWHGIVGSDSRQHPFVDEGLAQYSALLYVEEAHGADRARAEGEQQVRAGYHMMRLMGHADGRVDRPVAAFGEPVVYAGLVYGKGPYLYRALRNQVGDRLFFRQLRAHAMAHRFRTAPPRAFFDRLATGRHRRGVRALERRWLEQTHGDEDLGQADLGRMLGSAGGADANDPALRGLMEMLGGGGGTGGGADLGELMRVLGGSGGGGGGEGIDPEAAQRMLESLMTQ
ncbi:MAG: M1 family aminopeptidase [Sandaracinaceae bacterium]